MRRHVLTARHHRDEYDVPVHRQVGPGHLPRLAPSGRLFHPLILTLPHIWGLSGIELCQPIADGLTFCISVPFLLPFLKELKEQGDEE